MMTLYKVGSEKGDIAGWNCCLAFLIYLFVKYVVKTRNLIFVNDGVYESQRILELLQALLL